MVYIMFTMFACNKSNLSDFSTTHPHVPTGENITLLPPALPQALTAIYFTSDQTGFVAGATGGIYKTTDGGNNWQTLNSPVTLPIYGLFFVSQSTGFAVGGDDSCTGTGCTIDGGFILRTTDGGQNWAKVYTPANKIELNSVYFVNSSVGFCIGNNVIFKTTNGGNSWTEQAIDNLGGKMMQVKFADQNKGYIACLFDKIVQTNDGGKTWTVTSPQTDKGYYSVAAAEGATYVSGQGKIIKSTNNGSSWNILTNAPADIYALYFKDAQDGIAFGTGEYSGGDFGYSYAAIYTTSDGGSTWAGSSAVKDYRPIYNVSFPGGNTGFGLNMNRVIKISY